MTLVQIELFLISSTLEIPKTHHNLLCSVQYKALTSLHWTYRSNLTYSSLNNSMTLDTPGNRKGMPNADFNQWTPLEYVAK